MTNVDDFVKDVSASLEPIMVNGIDVRQHVGFCAGPSNTNITRSDAMRIRKFIDEAIASGALTLEPTPSNYKTEAGE